MSIVSCRSLYLATTVLSHSEKFVNAPGAAKKKKALQLLLVTL